jgi:hypothetical protein
MVPALISAAVAFTILAISQWIIHRRETSALLLSKLEDLYFLLLEMGSRNMERFEPFLIAAAQGGAPNQWPLKLEKMLMADLLERLELLVSFHFPQLKDSMQRLFDLNRDCTEVVVLNPGKIWKRGEVTAKSEPFANEMAVLRRRIIAERSQLIKSWRGEFSAKLREFTEG